MQGTYFTSQHFEEEGGGDNYTMERYVQSYKNVSIQKPRIAHNTEPLPSTGVMYMSVSSVLIKMYRILAFL